MSKRSFQTRLRNLCLLAIIALCIPLIAGFFGRVHPAFDSLAHFRAHLAALIALCSLPLVLGSMWHHAALGLSLALASFLTLVPLQTLLQNPSRDAHASLSESGPLYRLLQLNLRFDNPDPTRVLSLIGRENPDIIIFQEVSEQVSMLPERLKHLYSHQIKCPDISAVGSVAILSRRPFLTQPLCEKSGRLAIVTVDLNGQPVQVAGVHLGWPWPFEQPEEVASLEPVFAALADDALVAGDFNAAGWSNTVRRIALAGGLTRGSHTSPTWLHHSLPKVLRPIVGLPLDHALSKGAVQIVNIRSGEDAGSDHTPLLIDFAIGREPSLAEGSTVVETHEKPATSRVAG
ncbi:endonuclease/exonuclease/phosphatase family protein [Limoniibacter endophyticus]|uniref:Endonuclease/exonuclease/phosphatase n=1 Tax=Limoniibacter endophyticus TaxID=1565040 RepID=A0A8J3DGX0_9HYPH|nr:endonuclease/exonuclease/phosphatase family protein [Limoniibacter endophyticus]GHC69202.1 endonuclease/exonuclease/phosphatase [Limoniibacter endophyticus]